MNVGLFIVSIMSYFKVHTKNKDKLRRVTIEIEIL